MRGRSERIFRWKFFPAALVLALAVLLAATVCGRTAFASDSGGEKTGSIRLTLPDYAGDVSMAIYLVASYDESGFTWLSDFADSGVQISDLNDSSLAQAAAKTLETYVTSSGKSFSPAAQAQYSATDGGMVFSNLTPGLYLVTQSAGSDSLAVQSALVPIPYSSEEGAGWIYDAVISPKYSFGGGAVIVTKKDDEGNVLGGAVFVLQQKVYTADETPQAGAETGTDADGEYFWREFQANLVSSTQGQVVITDLPLGEYRFIETDAPDGYILDSTPVYFSVTKAGTVQETSGLYQTASGETVAVSVTNAGTKVTVNKVDETGKQLAGATLVVKDANGKVLRDSNGNASYLFSSGETAQVLRTLPAGNYYLSEVSAPDGYALAEDVAFSVSESADAENTVTMVDEKKPTPSGTETVQGSLTVTKSLKDSSGNAILAGNATYYVALYSDEARTKRISNVQAITFQNAISSSVTFTGLEIGKTYYVGETDEAGEAVESTVSGTTVFVPEYPESVAVKMTAKSPEGTFAFDNTFYQLPDGFYYGGYITVTKKTLKGSEEYNTNDVFYAAVFADSAYTSRVGDVIVLDMDGGSETSAQVEVPIGTETDSKITYYVTETDKDGNPVENGADLEYVVSVEGSEVTLTGSNTIGNVTITNTFAEATPTPTPTPKVTEATAQEITTAVTPAASQGTGGTSSDNVKTGDDTPIAQTVVILVLAAVVVLAVIVIRRRKK